MNSADEVIDAFIALCNEKRAMLQTQIALMEAPDGYRVRNGNDDVTAETILENKKTVADFDSVLMKAEVFKTSRPLV